MRPFTAALLAALVFSTSAVSQEASAPLTIVVEGTARTIRAATLQKLPRDSTRMAFHGQAPVLYQGVSLAAVLHEAGVRSDSLRGPALTTRLVIEALDGFRVMLSLADLDPTLGGRRMLLADRLDGKPLPQEEAPLRLIIVGDQRPSRSVRQVVRIRVITESR